MLNRQRAQKLARIEMGSGAGAGGGEADEAGDEPFIVAVFVALSRFVPLSGGFSSYFWYLLQ